MWSLGPYGSSFVETLLNASFFILISRKEKLQRECLVAREEKVVTRGENQKRELSVIIIIIISSHRATVVGA